MPSPQSRRAKAKAKVQPKSLPRGKPDAPVPGIYRPLRSDSGIGPDGSDVDTPQTRSLGGDLVGTWDFLDERKDVPATSRAEGEKALSDLGATVIQVCPGLQVDLSVYHPV